MKNARILYKNKEYKVNFLVDDKKIVLPNGKILEEDYDDIIWLPPTTGNMFALGLNYIDHAKELNFQPPSEPLVFIKTSNSYTGHKQFSWRPNNVKYMHYECELVAVIGKTARNIKKEKALNYLAGYTICNDYAIRDYLENYYRPNLRVKNRDKTTPIGPWIVDVKDIENPNNLVIKTWINGKLCQEGNTKDMIFKIPELIQYLSSFMTLKPGDMIATGTPEGLADVKAGDEVITEIEGIGKLINYMKSEEEFFKLEQLENKK